MKVLILIFFSFFFLNLLIAHTTQEEFNYITKSYKIKLESGLDMKKGYNLIDLGNCGINHGLEKRNYTFKDLVRNGQTKPCALLLIYKRQDILNGSENHICIPSYDASEDIWNQTLKFIYENFKDNILFNNTIIWVLMKLSSQEISK